jgi:hypothetical protein
MPNKTTETELASVSCVDATYCEAVGTIHRSNSWIPSGSDTPVIMHFDGRTWSRSLAPNPTNGVLHGVDCARRGSCVAVGQVNGDPLVEELHGTTWAVTPAPKPDTFAQNYSWLQSVSCRAVDECVAVGVDSGTGYARGVEPNLALIEQQGPNGWQLAPPVAPLVPTPMPSATGDVTVPFNDLDASFLISVSCWAAGCVAVGDGESYVLRGGSWSAISSTLANSVSCSAGGTCTAVGPKAAIQDYITLGTIEMLSGSAWKSYPQLDIVAGSNLLDSVSCATSQSCVVVGSYAGSFTATSERSGILIDVQHNNVWRQFTIPQKSSESDDDITSVSCPSPHLCIGVGPGSVGPQVPSGPVHTHAVRIIP